MEIDYKYVESTIKPAILEVEDGTVYVRKDITSVVRTSKRGHKSSYWTYQEAILTPEEFNTYTNLVMAENAIKGVNDSNNIVQIMTGQETGDNNQLAIMEAIADLYEAIAGMTA